MASDYNFIIFPPPRYSLDPPHLPTYWSYRAYPPPSSKVPPVTPPSRIQNTKHMREGREAFEGFEA